MTDGPRCPSSVVESISPDWIPATWAGQSAFKRLFSDVSDAKRALAVLQGTGDEIVIAAARAALAQAIEVMFDEIEAARGKWDALEHGGG